MYRLVITPRAEKHLKKIQKDHQLDIKTALEEIREDPSIGKPLERDLKGRFSYRIRVYRIIYRINEVDKVVNILSAEHRSRAYN